MAYFSVFELYLLANAIALTSQFGCCRGQANHTAVRCYRVGVIGAIKCQTLYIHDFIFKWLKASECSVDQFQSFFQQSTQQTR